jgi:hypothetical protein
LAARRAVRIRFRYEQAMALKPIFPGTGKPLSRLRASA